jgi:hypothetical protein
MLRIGLVASCLLFGFTVSLPAGQFEVAKNEAGVEIKYDGKLVTNFVQKSNTKPILWPIIGPGGHEMTRAYPMRQEVPGEPKDHPHHRSFWFTHGEVNGVNFWLEESKKEKPGHINVREYLKVEGGERATISTRNDWVAPDGTKVCEEVQTLVISKPGDLLVIDFQSVVTASEKELHFGDTKEGAFGVRVASSMDVDAKKGGHIVNSEGLTDKAAWGQKAAWVDYSGPVNGETAGIAILQHPTSYRYPNRWHVRTYGLFTANPFGEKDFPGGNAADGHHLIAKGKSITLKYRVLFHPGDAKAAKIAEQFQAYTATK